MIVVASTHRDPVRSCHSRCVTVRALRWVSMMLLVPITWVRHTRPLASPIVLAPSKHYDDEHNRRHNVVP